MTEEQERKEDSKKIAVGHNPVPKPLLFVYGAIILWSFYYVFFAPPTLSYSRPDVIRLDVTTLLGQRCSACHIVEGRGGVFGPSLDDVGLRMSGEELRLFLNDPGSRNELSATTMEQVFQSLSIEEQEDIALHLADKK
ncbi:cytochrome c [Heliorestis acidaminivorans]|uniref:Cytochrome c n=1 Tax=Heliorestis acidaminivorans TaxID=553427 RepID=A0A6I0EYB5_9FIRM|nr:c-type cytochrome [Heliorestis acidaminivorans]KAB2953401.1 cytochrome c [Heliorestis acidaminivorans]